MSSQVFISIIVPTYNRAELIKNTLLSLINQTYQNYEIIVVDDGGKDNTKEIVESLNHPKISYHWKKNAERGAARNFGAKLAKGDVLNFFDSDDLAKDNHLNIAASFFSDSESRTKIFHSSYCYVSDGHLSSYYFLKGKLNEKVNKNNCLSCNNVFIPKEIFAKHSFSELRDLSASEDWELWLRLSDEYEIIGSDILTSMIVQHDNRSMVVANLASTEKRMSLLMDLVRRSALKIRVKNNVYSECTSYIALMMALESQRWRAFKTWLAAIQYNFQTIFSRRTLAIFKHIIFIK